MSVERRSQRAPRRAHRGRHERLARPDPPQPDQQRRARAAGREDSLRGVTSNPAIFEKAILGSTDYDEQLARARAARACDAREIYDADRDHGRAARLRRPAPGLGRAGRRRRLRLARGRARLRARHRGHARAGARLLGARRPPQPDDQDPGTDEGVPAIEEAISEGININVTLLFSRRGVHARSPRPTSAGSSAASTRASRSTCTRWRASSSRAWTPRSTSASRRWTTRTCAESRRVANARAAYQRFKELFHGERFAALRDAGRAGAAAAVGLDRREEPALPRDHVRRRAGRAATPSTRCRWRRCSPAREQREVTGATADQDPTADLERAAPTRASTWTT